MKGRQLPAGAVWSMLSIASLGFSGCTNNPPSIQRIGEAVVPDSLTDYLTSELETRVDLLAFEDVPLVVRVVAEDPDGDPLQYSAGPLPRGATFDAITGEFNYESETGLEYEEGMEIYFVVQDPYGEWDSVVAHLTTIALD